MTDNNISNRAQALFEREYEPSPVARISNTVALYEATGGTEGNTMEDRPTVILTTIGAQSGKVRKNPIMRIKENDIYIAVASAAGAPKHPFWYGNMVAHSEVRLQDGSKIYNLRERAILS